MNLSPMTRKIAAVSTVLLTLGGGAMKSAAAEAPIGVKAVASEVLPAANRLVKLSPDFAVNPDSIAIVSRGKDICGIVPKASDNEVLLKSCEDLFFKKNGPLKVLSQGYAVNLDNIAIVQREKSGNCSVLPVMSGQWRTLPAEACGKLLDIIK